MNEKYLIIRMVSRVTGMLCTIALLLFIIREADAHSDDEFLDDQSIRGTVISEETGEPVGWVTMHIQELDRTLTTHEDGSFEFTRIPSGTHFIRAQRVGYETKEYKVEVREGEIAEVEIQISETVFRSDVVEVRGTAVERDELELDADFSISGSRLRQQLGQTIAETLDDEPGLAQRTMGPAPSRPVLRGLGGDRLLILEDGGRTGDLSATAADHALAIEPMTAEQIELIRGPSSLVYGSNTLGGVINVHRGQIPTNLIDHHHGSVSFQGESVNRGTSGGVRSYGPIAGNFAYRADASIRNAQNIGTPAGTLDNTGITTLNASLGTSWLPSWGMIGVSGNYYDTEYGVPGGEGIAGAHPGGVDIEMYRRYLEAKAQIELGSGFARRLDFNGTYSYYHHKELEYGQDRETPIVGSEFGVLTTNIKGKFHHRGNRFLESGIIGSWYEYRDYAAGGLTFPTTSDEHALAGFAYQKWNVPSSWNVESALRYDYRRVTPSEEVFSAFIGQLREREFTGFSASVTAEYNITSDIRAGFTGIRSYQAPGVDELFSEGPHLAVYRFEKGNPDLEDEQGLGTELFTRISTDRLRFRGSIFRNQIDDYIYVRNTGEESLKRTDLTAYQFSGDRVLMHGAEANYELRLTDWLMHNATFSYVRGEFIDPDSRPPFLSTSSGDGIPLMPPFNGRVELEYNRSDLKVGLRGRFATDQDRTDEYEVPTDGYLIGDLYAQYNLEYGNQMHTFSFTLENFTNTEYRQHLSQIREIMPEPGINAKLLYRFYF